jgi:cell division protein FtsL
MRFRVSGFVMMAVLAVMALGLYLVKYWVQDVKREAAQVEATLQSEQEALHLLKAEWAYLNRPERLAGLSKKYLELAPVTSVQFVSFAALPDTGDAAIVAAEITPDSPFFQPVSTR